MTLEEKIKKAEEKSKDSVVQIFNEKPDEMKKELEKEKILGNSKNLIKPDNENE